jgi:hypothetical protein
MGIVRDDPIAVSGVNAQIELFDEKYMDPPGEESTEQERHLHNYGTCGKLIGIARGLAAAVLALSKPAVITINSKQE